MIFDEISKYEIAAELIGTATAKKDGLMQKIYALNFQSMSVNTGIQFQLMKSVKSSIGFIYLYAHPWRDSFCGIVVGSFDASKSKFHHIRLNGDSNIEFYTNRTSASTFDLYVKNNYENSDAMTLYVKNLFTHAVDFNIVKADIPLEATLINS